MPRYEYKVVPAPSKGIKGKGVRGAEARFSFAIQELMNGMAGYGWEYQRAETLPSIERSGLTSTTTEWRNVLIFRRLRASDAAEFLPELLPAPEDEHAAKAEVPPTESETAHEAKKESTGFPADNGVEDTGSEKGVGASLSILARARNAMKAPAPDEPGTDERTKP